MSHAEVLACLHGMDGALARSIRPVSIFTNSNMLVTNLQEIRHSTSLDNTLLDYKVDKFQVEQAHHLVIIAVDCEICSKVFPLESNQILFVVYVIFSFCLFSRYKKKKKKKDTLVDIQQAWTIQKSFKLCVRISITSLKFPLASKFSWVSLNHFLKLAGDDEGLDLFPFESPANFLVLFLCKFGLQFHLLFIFCLFIVLSSSSSSFLFYRFDHHLFSSLLLPSTTYVFFGRL